MTMLQNSLNHSTCQVPEEKHPTPQVLAAWQALRDTRAMRTSAEDVQEAQTGVRLKEHGAAAAGDNFCRIFAS